MEMVDFKQMVYLPDEDRYSPVDEVPAGRKTADISGTQVRESYLAKGRHSRVVQPPGRGRDPQRDQPAQGSARGLTIWFTGLSGSGKSTVAHALVERLAEFGRNVSSCSTATRSAPTSPRASASARKTATPTSTASATSPAWSPARRPTLSAVISPYRETRDKARTKSGDLRRGLLRHPDRGLRAARRQGPLRQGPRRRDQGVHRRRRSVRGPAEPRGPDRHRQAVARGVGAADPRLPRGPRPDPVGRAGGDQLAPLRTEHVTRAPAGPRVI